MKPNLLFGATGSAFFFTITFLAAQTAPDSSIVASTAPSDPENPLKRKHWLWRNVQLTGGQLTLPFKIRKNDEHNTFRLTTDVTLGGYVGYTRRLSEKREFYLTIPFTAGVTFINLTDNNTTFSREEAGADVVPGLTWSTGLVLQLDKYNLGLLLGKDYAGDVGNQWEYHGKVWWSFGVGFVFLQ